MSSRNYVVLPPKKRNNWEDHFNPVLQMSHSAISQVNFRCGVERMRYRSQVKAIARREAQELRGKTVSGTCGHTCIHKEIHS